jgi:hypothetical protein
MTPNLPSNSDGSALPPRSRPNMGNLSKDTTETDLWAFDDLDPADPPAAKSPPPAERTVPEAKSSLKPANPEGSESVLPVKEVSHLRPAAGQERIQVNVNKAKTRAQSASALPSTAKPGDDFDDLAHWEDSAAAVAPTLRVEPVPEAVVAPEKFQQAPPQAPAPPEDDADEFSSVAREGATPVSLRPHLSLTKIERVGMVVLLVILLVGAGALVVYSLSGLPTESARAAANDFPIKGRQLTVGSAASYWRQPILDGANPDTFRRGTILLPALTLEIADGTAGLRVIFRNQDGESIGDIVTRSVRGGSKLEIPATAGFDDVGMHAAYRTGESKPWTVEVLEAPSADSPNDAFVRLFEMNISTDRR